ncbi:MAG: alpha/beta hydrolase [Chitinophagales bacterium]|nr:alpha/beta hydrolase [Chitinophagales bacterium]
MNKSISFLDITSAYSDEGEGQAIALIHGFCEDSSVWDDFKKDLSKNFRVIIPDLPGYGNSALPKQPLTIEWMADFIYAILQNENISNPIIIGHSMGGYITLALVEKHPDFPQKIGLFHSHAFADDEEKKKFRQKGIEFVQKNGARDFVNELVPNLFAEKFRAEHKATVELQKMNALAYPAETITSGLKAMILRSDKTHVLKAYRKPVLFILGKEDKAIPYGKSLEQCQYPAISSVHFLENVGHMGMLEEPEKTLGIVQEFINLNVDV